jgi:hypothetical protein
MLSILTFMLAGCIYNILRVYKFLSFIHRLIEVFDPRRSKISVQSKFPSFLSSFRKKYSSENLRIPGI